MFDLADIGYFPYVRKRMTAEVFHLVGNKSDFIDLLPSYLLQFWFVPLAIIVLIAVFIFVNNIIIKRHNITGIKNIFSLPRLLAAFAVLPLSIVAIRGGFQLKPILNVNALAVTSVENTALVLNTPFSIIHTLEEKKLTRLSFYSEKEINENFNPIKNYARPFEGQKRNVVLILLESFGKQYTGIGGRKSYTPFLDSLMKQSLVFTNAYSNGHRSADGIPAAIAGMPVFQDEPFITSPYANNSIEALPSLLKKIGYTSSFFHGGTNGTMSFDLFASTSGFDKYIGRTEYNNDKDYDGTWGIWDEPFLQFHAKQLSMMKQPFFSTIFTLSSHEPFNLPEEYQRSEIAKLQGIYKGVTYTDHALRKYFNTIKNEAWFNNTLFVITTDHNFLANTDSLGYYNAGVGLYAAPMIFYCHDDAKMKGTQNQIMQQIDILPTVLDYLNYPYPFFAYGSSAFDSTAPHFIYTLLDVKHQWMDSNNIGLSNDLANISVYDFNKDSVMKKPIEDEISKRISLKQLQQFRQLIQNTLIDNRQSVKNYLNNH